MHPPHCRSNLVVQLQRELDLPRIVRSIARGSDFAKARAGEISGPGNRNHAIAAEIRRVEVWVIEDVKELGPELEAEALIQLHVLERREIHTPEPRPNGLIGRSTQSGHRAR